MESGSSSLGEGVETGSDNPDFTVASFLFKSKGETGLGTLQYISQIETLYKKVYQ